MSTPHTSLSVSVTNGGGKLLDNRSPSRSARRLPDDGLSIKRFTDGYESFTREASGILKTLIPLALVSSCATSSLALIAFAALVNPPEADCNARQVSDRTHLICLQIEIAKGDFNTVLKALDLVGGWEITHPLYNEAQGLLARWSAAILHKAERYSLEGKAAEAIELVKQIPPSSPQYLDSRSLLKRLRSQNRQIKKNSHGDAQAALQEQEWGQAFESLWRIQALEVDAVQSMLSDRLARRIEAERQAQKLLNRAIQEHYLGSVKHQAEAIAIASQIDPDTYVGESAQAKMDEWSDDLLPLGIERIDQGDLAGAAAIFKKIAQNPSRRHVAQEWLLQAQTQHLTQTVKAASVRTGVANPYPTLSTASSIRPETPWRFESTDRSPQASLSSLSPLLGHDPVHSERHLAPENAYIPVFAR